MRALLESIPRLAAFFFFSSLALVSLSHFLETESAKGWFGVPVTRQD